MEEATTGDRAVFFVDVAHFVPALFLSFLGSLTRTFIQAPAGRNRFNVLEALNAITDQLITVTNDTYINAESGCDLLRQIAGLNLGVPITLVMDHARDQKCKIVRQLASVLGIELLYLPTYSPNLNLIERFWKFIKKKCLYSKYYSEFSAVKNAITDCLSPTSASYKLELDFNFAPVFRPLKKRAPYSRYYGVKYKLETKLMASVG